MQAFLVMGRNHSMGPMDIGDRLNYLQQQGLPWKNVAFTPVPECRSHLWKGEDDKFGSFHNLPRGSWLLTTSVWRKGWNFFDRYTCWLAQQDIFLVCHRLPCCSLLMGPMKGELGMCWETPCFIFSIKTWPPSSWKLCGEPSLTHQFVVFKAICMRKIPLAHVVSRQMTLPATVCWWPWL